MKVTTTVTSPHPFCYFKMPMSFSSFLRLLVIPLFLWGCDSGKASATPPPPADVNVITLTPETVSIASEWIATLDGYVNAQIRPQVSGYLVRRTYQEGALVRQGQVL